MENVIKYGEYTARLDFDQDDEIFHGRVLNIDDIVTFEGSSISELQKEFKKSIDAYQKFCKKAGKTAGKPFSGRILLRTDPEVHRAISSIAEREGKSMNAVVLECVRRMISGNQPSKRAKPRAINRDKTTKRP